MASQFSACVATFGGVDILVSNAGAAIQAADGLAGDGGRAALEASMGVNFYGHVNVAEAATQIMLAQETGGCLLFNASKAALNPGRGFGPYAVAKAGVVALAKQYAADYGPAGIRASCVNADRVRTNLFTAELIAERAAKRGLQPDQYFKSNLLGVEVTAADVADAFVALALASKTTGAILTVDGGNIAAAVR